MFILFKKYFKFFKDKKHKFLFVFCFYLATLNVQSQQGTPVSRIYGDENGYYTSETSSLVTIKDSNNLVGFTVNGVAYSTGVNDALLTSNGVAFTPATFEALPVPGAVQYKNPELIGIGYNWGGVPQNNSPTDYIRTFSPIVPTFFIRDGINGLQLSTNFFNINSQNFFYENLKVSDIASVNDNTPDIIATQTGQPSGSDRFRFVDVNGNTVGNEIIVNFSSVAVVGGIDWTIYRVNPSTGSVTGVFGIDTYRDLRVLSFKLSNFGITATNAPQIEGFIHRTSGNTDIAFTAYNKDSFIVSTVELGISTSIDVPQTVCEANSVNLVATVTNNSTNTSTGFEVELPIPSGLSYTSNSAVFSSGSGTATYDSVNNKWIVPALNPGESVELTVQAEITPASLPITLNADLVNISETDTDFSNNSSSSVLSELDSDCDGVFDSADLDDDNDGILDEDEYSCGNTNVLGSNALAVVSNINVVSPSSAIGSDNIRAIFNENNSDELVIDFGQQIPSGTSIAIEGHSSIAASETLIVETSQNPTSGFGNQVTFTNFLIANTDQTFVFTLSSGSRYIRIRISGLNLGGEIRIDNVSFAGFTANVCSPIDTDLDGVPNHLDTDSDNDGCPDAIEAAGSFLTSDLVNFGVEGATGVDNSLGDTVNDNGIPVPPGTAGNGTTGQAITTAVTNDAISGSCLVDLSLTKTVNNALPKVGDNIIYTLTVKNDGVSSATGVLVTDVVPSGLTYQSHTASSGNFTDTDSNGIRDTWNIGTLAIGSSVTLEITVTVNNAGTIINKAEVTQSSETDSDSTANNGQ